MPAPAVFTTDDPKVIDAMERYLDDRQEWGRVLNEAEDTIGLPMLTWPNRGEAAGPKKPDGPAPAGWSASARRDWLIPTRGKPGEAARAMTARIEAASPGRWDERIREFGFPCEIMGGGRWWGWGVRQLGGRFYFSINAEALNYVSSSPSYMDRPSDPWDGTGTPFTPVKLSDYYRAVEDDEKVTA